MDFISSSALSSLETKGMTIWKSLGPLRQERLACWALTIPFPCLWSNLKISFSVFPQGRRGNFGCVWLLAEKFRRRHHRYAFANVGGTLYHLSFNIYLFIHLKGTWIYSRLEYCPSREYNFLGLKIFKYPRDTLQDAFHDNFVVQWHQSHSLFFLLTGFSPPRAPSQRLGTTVYSMAPGSLLIKPDNGEC